MRRFRDLLLPFLATLSLSAEQFPSQSQIVEREVFVMGTSLRMTLYDQERTMAITATEEILQVIEQANAQLSTWLPESELSRLNRQLVGIPFPASDSLFSLVQELQVWQTQTAGAFDAGIGQLTSTWGVHSGFRIPDKVEIRQALHNSGIHNLKLDDAGRTITRARKIEIDPGGFGKGVALDRAIEIAKRRGVSLFIDFGGHIAAWQRSGGGKVWDVAVAHPVDRLKPSAIRIALTSGSVSTSGGSERDGTVSGKRISHILDPSTGSPVNSFGSVTVWHSRAFDADILSTALYVMGVEKGYAWSLSNDIAACFLISEGMSVIRKTTPAFDRLIAP